MVGSGQGEILLELRAIGASFRRPGPSDIMIG